ncbi:hypothetical protein P355_1463 [Burkholderia cenocepacia KC-01]|nr:hypothetical protein P355_1463 [Burkholderia cenocepacia KC-01]
MTKQLIENPGMANFTGNPRIVSFDWKRGKNVVYAAFDRLYSFAPR